MRYLLGFFVVFPCDFVRDLKLCMTKGDAQMELKANLCSLKRKSSAKVCVAADGEGQRKKET